MMEASLKKSDDSYFTLEVLLVGGLSIITCACFWIFFDKANSISTIANFAFTMAFIANHPHFLSSYVLIYKDYQKNILSKLRYFFSAVVVPLLLLFVIGYSLYNNNRDMMGHIVTAMYYLVGWHYVKQIFGFVIVSSAHRKNYYTNFERKILLTNLFSIWFLSFLGTHVGASSFDFYGIPHHSLNLPRWLLQLDQSLVVLSLIAVISIHVIKYIRTGVKPAPPAVASFAALYVWYIPVLSHPGFSYLIPFFHSLQYLSFVWLFKKNQVQHEIKDLNGAIKRAAWLKKFAGFIVCILILGALSFEFIPKYLDNLGVIPEGSMGAAPFLAAFILFINIHHYFIDNTIWRSDNEAVKKFLFTT